MAFKGTESRSRPRDRRGHRERRRRSERRHLHRAHRLFRPRPQGGRAAGRRYSRRHPAELACSTSSELQREQQVIVQEIGAARDNPDDQVFDLFQEAAYPDQADRPHHSGHRRVGQELRSGCHPRLYGPQLCGRPAWSSRCRQRRSRRSGRHRRTTASTACSPTARPCPRRRRYVGGEERLVSDHEQAHIVLGFEGRRLQFGRLLRRADPRLDPRRRHELAPVPGSAREARPLLFGLCLPLGLRRQRRLRRRRRDRRTRKSTNSCPSFSTSCAAPPRPSPTKR